MEDEQETRMTVHVILALVIRLPFFPWDQPM
jgi:hypothetical protein